MVSASNLGYPVPAGHPVSVKVWGDFACFSRPEFAAERVSYPIMTPSAAVGVLDAIYWKPEFRWKVVAIDVLQRGTAFLVRRNEIGSRQSERLARAWQDKGGAYEATEDRQQRATMVLCGVAYVIHAHCEVFAGVGDHHAKHRDQLRKRVAHGQCHERPYLGCREFAAHFAEPAASDGPLDWDEDLGLMVRHVYPPGEVPRPTGGRAQPEFFRAHVERGRLLVPEEGRS